MTDRPRAAETMLRAQLLLVLSDYVSQSMLLHQGNELVDRLLTVFAGQLGVSPGLLIDHFSTDEAKPAP